VRILQVAKSSLAPAGHSHTVHHLSDALARRGHEVTVLALRPHPRDRMSLLATQRFAYHPELVRMPRTRGYLHDAIFTWAIRRLAASGRFDLVHAHMLFPEGHCALRALRGRRRLEVPLVVTGHGEDIQVDPACGYGVRLDRRIDRKVRRVLASADALIAIGEAMKLEMVAAGADPSRATVIRTGFNVAGENGTVAERLPAAAREPGYLLSVGRLVRKKGHDLLLRAMRRVVDRHPVARLVIAGEGPERGALERLAGALRLTPHVEFAGFVTGVALASLYARGSLFVCPSRWEPLGLVNLEAMASGLPVAAFRIDGIPEIVKEGESGLLANPEDEEDLAAAILRLMEDGPLRERMSLAAREAARPYEWEAVAGRHEDLYARILGSAGRGEARRSGEEPVRVA
jgi:glycogen(starch) synthase